MTRGWRINADRRADPVAEKHMANFCEHFEMVRRVFTPQEKPASREDAAREQLKRLFGD